MTFSPGLPWFALVAVALFAAATVMVRPMFLPVPHSRRVLALLVAVPLIFLLAGGAVVCGRQTLGGSLDDADACSPAVAFSAVPAWVAKLFR